MSGAIVLALIIATTSGTHPENAAGSSELCRLVAAGYLAGLHQPDFSNYRTKIEDFYGPAGYAPAWTDRGVPTAPAQAIIAALASADIKGLDPEDYDGSRWAGRLQQLKEARASEADLARFDLALTVSLMRYISDLHSGRANPGIFHRGFDLPDGETDLARFIRQRLVSATDVNRVLQSVEPPYPGYWRTERALQQYMALAREDSGEPLPRPQKTIDPGAPYAGISRLASLLRELGDLPPDAALADPAIYGGPLVAAVKHFQGRHGLDPDGRLGKATIAELNTPLSKRVRQLALTLERWRWMPHHYSQPPVVVNIPEFRLCALNRGYESELSMKVVVGRAWRHQTPIFAAEMTHVIFRPYWDVPPSILRAELLPKLAQEPSYFIKHGYEVVDSRARAISRGEVNEEILGGLRSGKFRVRQVPGGENALGLVKFVFPNRYDVYLHGTPATSLFARTRRDFSHGCIRVEKPAELAAWVLRSLPEWTPERILQVMNGGRTLQVNLPAPIPVLIVYGTAVVPENGEVDFFADIYGQDAALERSLASRSSDAAAASAPLPNGT